MRYRLTELRKLRFVLCLLVNAKILNVKATTSIFILRGTQPLAILPLVVRGALESGTLQDL